MISLPLGIKTNKKEKNKAIFEIDGLYPGYGITIGNSLRRVLLSSLEGAAITDVKIKGVSHEFSTIPGVMEDVVMILLNLKKIRFKNYSDEPQNITLSVKGEKEVKAKDFKLTAQLEIANPEVHIASLSKPSAELYIEARVQKGIGYEIAELRTTDKMEVGAIKIDSIFTPIKNVSLKISNMRVGTRTDFDKLSIEVETDGTMDPEQAMVQATEILIKHFEMVFDAFSSSEKKKNSDKKKVESDKTSKKSDIKDKKEKTKKSVSKAK